jgi:hypothetical protein
MNIAINKRLSDKRLKLSESCPKAVRQPDMRVYCEHEKLSVRPTVYQTD